MALDSRVYRLVDDPSNVYLVDDGDLTLVDAGVPGSAKPIRDGIRALGHAVVDVDRVLLTHYDYDHVGALASLGLDAPIHAGEPDATYVTGAAKPPLSNAKGLMQRVLGRNLDFPDLTSLPVTDDEEIGDFRAYRTPGHTAGHTVYLHSGFDIAFLGDCVRESEHTLQPMPGWLCADSDRNHESIKKLSERTPTFDYGAPGHGDPITAGASAVLRRVAAGL
ncbi:MBL fold metallo-hydrolase [Halalkalicoccus sp. NIPERK01]|uniref:MBL fold metallo-hydrolase n=1 Tax=Halalkalicoccus sp. NIPERK01 TaxID=3053469 RepID=UPI00256EC64C|nr:MBL fold metallo-hydrolase [Halalkalicoccus sp. NIPERK01]MDL5362667.1 MBL fold metallo-hydrolase [Halalkalicoccus sp. NIPERK01]